MATIKRKAYGKAGGKTLGEKIRMTIPMTMRKWESKKLRTAIQGRMSKEKSKKNKK